MRMSVVCTVLLPTPLVGSSQDALAAQLGVGLEVVEHLGEESGHVDGVGRREEESGVEFGVEERLFYECLAVVESAVNLDGGDVSADGGKLTFLNSGDLVFGIEHVDADAVDTEETVGHGRTCVAARGCEHVDLAAFV